MISTIGLLLFGTLTAWSFAARVGKHADQAQAAAVQSAHSAHVATQAAEDSAPAVDEEAALIVQLDEVRRAEKRLEKRVAALEAKRR